ncbi:MAG: alpha/beta fold hydrolase, partial [Oscillochloris sp.]|nr:alpha/beta fold hydrolase [Oscillochloris sp.]
MIHEPLHQAMVAGSPVYYRRRGAGLPLLLLHGWGGSSHYWRNTLDRLGTTHDVIAPDLPGFGDSPPLEGKHAGGQLMADMVIAFADQLGLTQLDLNGHSFSAGV